MELRWNGQQFDVSQTLVGGATQSGGPFPFPGKPLQYNTIHHNRIQCSTIQYNRFSSTFINVINYYTLKVNVK